MDKKRRIDLFRLTLWMVFCLLLYLGPLTAGAAVIYVDADASGAGTGTSWGNACPELGDAMNSAVDGDQIWVAAGTYHPTRDKTGSTSPADNRDKTFYFKSYNSLKLYGGFDGTDGSGGGTLETDLSQRDPAANETVLSGDLNGDDDSGGDNSENAYHVVYFDAIDQEVLLDGFTITAGNADGAYGSYLYGGGIYNYVDGGTIAPVVNNCVIKENAANSGGGVANWGTSITVGANLLMTDCDIRENSASIGGALHINTSAPELRRCLLRGNTASGAGGGVYNYSGAPRLINCAISGNNTQNGGGVYTSNIQNNNSPLLRNCTISGNYASDLGGAMYNSTVSSGLCNPTLVNCIVWNNDSGNSIKDIYNDAASTPRYKSCDIMGCEGSGAGWDTALGTDEGGNIDVNPDFFTSVSPAGAPTVAGDFHITLTSACVGAGTAIDLTGTNYIPGDDFDGELRNSPRDIGVDEALDTDGDGIRNLDDTDDDDDGVSDLDEATAGTDPLKVDTDNDGLTDYEELNTYPTDPLDPDSDDDGITDGWEVDYGLNPKNPDDAAENWDTDSLDNLTEFQNNTNPNDPDTDDDNMPDDWEVNNSLDPLTNDAAGDPDFDRITNMDEYTGGTDPQVYHIYTGVIYVDKSAGGADNGTSWTDAFASLQDALGAGATLTGGAVFWVAAGTYYPDEGTGLTDGARSYTFNIKDNFQVYGGFSGIESSLSERNWETNVTTLSGDLNQDDTSGGGNSENANRVVTFDGVSDLTILDGFTVCAGNADYYFYFLITIDRRFGGGIYITGGANPGINNCKITGNTALLDGGGVYIDESSEPQLSNCVISDNNAGRNGGGLYVSGSADPVLIDCDLNGNSAAGIGGGIYGYSGYTLTGCIISENFAGGDGGGGIYNYCNATELTDCVITGNTTAGDGGGIYNKSYLLTSCSSSLTNCLISGNSAENGGGMCNLASLGTGSCSPVLINCTFSGNSVSGSGNEMYNVEDSFATCEPQMINCIIWNDLAIVNSVASPGYSYCDIKGSGGSTAWVSSFGTDNGNNIDADPLFVSQAAGDLHLVAGSPCLDTGNNSANSETTDLDGEARIQNGTIDMGAYEGAEGAVAVSSAPNLINWNDGVSDKLAVDFGGNGMWYHDGSAWHWMTNKGNVGQMAVWNGNLVVDFGAGNGMQYYDGSWHWMTNRGGVAAMISWNDGTSERLVVDFGAGERVYTYDGSWHWFTNKDGVAGMTVWDKKLVVDFGAGRGVYNYDTAWHWMTNKDDVAGMLAWDNGAGQRLLVDFGGGRGIYTYDGAWDWFSNKDDVNDMTVWNQKLVVDFGAGRAVYNYDTAWHWMTNKDDVARMVAWNDGVSDKLAVDFGSGRGMSNYDGSWHWMRNDDNVPEMIAWGNLLAVDFGAGAGIYNYDGAWNLMKNWSTAD